MSLKSTNLYKNLQKQYSRRINLNLSRIKKVLKKLDNPHLDLKNPINILGSDGKMSVLTSLKFFLEAENKSVNTFTSPHLYDVRQRIYLKNRFISVNEIKKFKKIIEKKKVKLTLFELLTCIYILAAKSNNATFNLIESGLLFKKDSTNLWGFPKSQVVTNINFQHQDWVKPKTIKEICNQKVGYLSKKTVIYVAKQKPSTLKIIKSFLRKNPSKVIYDNNWRLQKVKNNYVFRDKKNYIPIQSKHIHSEGLINNLCLAIKIALDLGVKRKTIIKVIPKIKFEGRLQYLKRGKLLKNVGKNEDLLIDGCHSYSSAVNLNNYLKKIKKPIYGIWGMQKNKLPEKFIQAFYKNLNKIITVKIPNEPNSLDPKILSAIAKKNGFEAEPAKNVINALKKLSNKKKKTIVIFGSLYLVGDVLRKNKF